MIDNISNRYTELYSILTCLDEIDKAKIPSKVWKEIEKRKNNKYEYSYTPGDEKYLNDYTIAMLNEIYLNYFKIN